MIITLKMLEKAHACEDQRELFKRTFGDRVRVTLKNCIKAQEAGLDINWAAHTFFEGDALGAYSKIMNRADTMRWESDRTWEEGLALCNKARAYAAYAGALHKDAAQ